MAFRTQRPHRLSGIGPFKDGRGTIGTSGKDGKGRSEAVGNAVEPYCLQTIIG